MTIDSPQANPPPAYTIPPEYVQQPLPNQNYAAPSPYPQTTVIRTKRAGGSGLVGIGIFVWLFSLFFLYDYGLFWTLQVISYALCCVGSCVAYSGARQYRTYIVSQPSYEYVYPQSYPNVNTNPNSTYPAPPSNPVYV